MIRVQSEDFDVGAEFAKLTDGPLGARLDIGGIASFIGVMRGTAPDQGRPITAMTLEHYPGMTERELGAIEAEAHRRWPLIASTIIHRHGRLVPGDRIVLVLTASSHRQAALDACAFLIDFLKTRAPFWKQEEYGDATEWVAARASDEDAAAAWADPLRAR